MQPVPGQLVTSRQGRDLERHYVVVGATPDGYLLLADGNRRSVSRPKRKNWKHVVAHPAVDLELQRRLATGAPLEDREVEEALNRLLARREGVGDGGATRRDRSTRDSDRTPSQRDVPR